MRNKVQIGKTLFVFAIFVVTRFSTTFSVSIPNAEKPIQSLTIDQAVDIALNENLDLRAAQSLRLQVSDELTLSMI